MQCVQLVLCAMQVLDWDTVCKRDCTEENCVHATRNMILYLIRVKPEYRCRETAVYQALSLFL